ncbi:MAG: peptidoglycan-binding protein [Deltaproteobacteria bacterium]|nr:peptidoglycan-binding protein [Deltaproteobacteria bacterium]
MKKNLIFITFILICGFIIGACQSMPDITGNIMGMKDKLLGPKRTYQSVDPESLPPVSKLAIAAFEMEKQGLLDSFPFAKIDAKNRKIHNKTDYTKFTERNIAIVDFQQNQDGSYVQTMMSECIDSFGRIDISENRIVFSVRNPTEDEVAEMTTTILDTLNGLKPKNKKAREEIKHVIAEYQRAGGLTADGVPGRKTAESLAREIPILDVSEISSAVLYPQKPMAELYVIPYETVDKNVSMFNKGFDSLDAVRKNALTPDKFGVLAKPQQRFVLFVYFFDRVNPELPVRIALAPNEQRWSNDFITPIRYAGRDVWPVMIETMCIDESFGSERIFANIFMKYKCIGSFRIN